MSQAPGWDGILDPDEKILWQGQPDGALHWRARNASLFVFGLFFAGFALFWMIMAAQAGGTFWMFGLIHFAVGIGLSVGPVYWNAWRRRHSWYTLTDRRAFIATDLPLTGRGLKSYPISEDTVLEFEDADLPSIWFEQEMRRSKNGRRMVKIGFERIADGREVYGLLRGIQREAE